MARRRPLAPVPQDRGDAHVHDYHHWLAKGLMEVHDGFRPEIRSAAKDYAVSTGDLWNMRTLPERIVRLACERSAKAMQKELWGGVDVVPGMTTLVRRRK